MQLPFEAPFEQRNRGIVGKRREFVEKLPVLVFCYLRLNVCLFVTQERFQGIPSADVGRPRRSWASSSSLNWATAAVAKACVRGVSSMYLRNRSSSDPMFLAACVLCRRVSVFGLLMCKILHRYPSNAAWSSTAPSRLFVILVELSHVRFVQAVRLEFAERMVSADDCEEFLQPSGWTVLAFWKKMPSTLIAS